MAAGQGQRATTRGRGGEPSGRPTRSLPPPPVLSGRASLLASLRKKNRVAAESRQSFAALSVACARACVSRLPAPLCCLLLCEDSNRPA
jgi:hypothetical protein